MTQTLDLFHSEGRELGHLFIKLRVQIHYTIAPSLTEAALGEQ